MHRHVKFVSARDRRTVGALIRPVAAIGDIHLMRVAISRSSETPTTTPTATRVPHAISMHSTRPRDAISMHTQSRSLTLTRAPPGGSMPLKSARLIMPRLSRALII